MRIIVYPLFLFLLFLTSCSQDDSVLMDTSKDLNEEIFLPLDTSNTWVYDYRLYVTDVTESQGQYTVSLGEGVLFEGLYFHPLNYSINDSPFGAYISNVSFAKKGNSIYQSLKMPVNFLLDQIIPVDLIIKVLDHTKIIGENIANQELTVNLKDFIKDDTIPDASIKFYLDTKLFEENDSKTLSNGKTYSNTISSKTEISLALTTTLPESTFSHTESVPNPIASIPGQPANLEINAKIKILEKELEIISKTVVNKLANSFSLNIGLINSEYFIDPSAIQLNDVYTFNAEVTVSDITSPVEITVDLKKKKITGTIYVNILGEKIPIPIDLDINAVGPGGISLIAEFYNQINQQIESSPKAIYKTDLFSYSVN